MRRVSWVSVLAVLVLFGSLHPQATRAQATTPTPTPTVKATASVTVSAISVEVGNTVTVTATVRNESSPGVIFPPSAFTFGQGQPSQGAATYALQANNAVPSMSGGQSATVVFTLLALNAGVINTGVSISFYEACDPHGCALGGSGASASGPTITVTPPAAVLGLGLQSFAATTIPGPSSTRSPLAFTWKTGQGVGGYRIAELAPAGPTLLPESGSLSPATTGFSLSTANVTGLTCYLLIATDAADDVLGYSDALCLAPNSARTPIGAGMFTLGVPQPTNPTLSWTTTTTDTSPRSYVVLNGPTLPAVTGSTDLPTLVPACISLAVISANNAIKATSDVLCVVPGIGAVAPTHQ